MIKTKNRIRRRCPVRRPARRNHNCPQASGRKSGVRLPTCLCRKSSAERRRKLGRRFPASFRAALTIPTKVSATGVIYGSVNSLQIADELKKLGFDIDRKIIVVKDVKEVGSYHATVKLHKEVSVEIPFEVVAEEA